MAASTLPAAAASPRWRSHSARNFSLEPRSKSAITDSSTAATSTARGVVAKACEVLGREARRMRARSASKIFAVSSMW